MVFFLKNIKLLEIDTQKDHEAFIFGMNELIDSDWYLISKYADLLVFNNEELDILSAEHKIEEDMHPSAYENKISISIFILQIYLYQIWDFSERYLKLMETVEDKFDRSRIPNLNSILNPLLEDLEKSVLKASRFVKYSLCLLESVACKRDKTKEVVYRNHFDFFYIAYLNFLFGMIEKMCGTTVQKIFENQANQMTTFLLVLVEMTNCRYKNFNLSVEIKKRRFTVQCNSLAYRLVLDILLIDEQPLWDVERFEDRKDEILNSDFASDLIQKTRECVTSSVIKKYLLSLFSFDFRGIHDSVQSKLLQLSDKFIIRMVGLCDISELKWNSYQLSEEN